MDPITISSVDVVIALVVLLIIAYKQLTRNRNFFVKKNLRHLKARLIVGNLGPAVFRTKSFTDLTNDIYMSFKGHRIGGFFAFTKPVIMVRDPEIIKLITVKDFEHFTDHPNLIPEEADPIFAANLFFRKGQKWKNMRDTLTPAFTSSKMKSMVLLITKCGVQLAEYIEEQLRRSGEETIQVEMRDAFSRYANDVIATCAFGISCDSLKDQKNKFYAAGKKISNFSGFRQLIFFGFMMSAKLMTFLKLRFIEKNTSEFLCEIVNDAITLREKQNIVRPDMINLLMQAKKGELRESNAMETAGTSSSNKEKISNIDIAAQAIVFFLAGFDGASQLLGFASLLLAMHPEIQRRLQQEVDKVLDENDGNITHEGLRSMKYLEMVLTETLRLYPPPFVDRECTKPYVIPLSEDHPEISFQKGDRVWIPVYGIHLDPIYYPNPTKFDPERFSDERKANIKPFTYMPFGSGPRTCIGNRFVLMESKVALAIMMSRFNFKIIDKSPVPIKLSKKAFTPTVDNGFWIGVTLRNRTKTY